MKRRFIEVILILSAALLHPAIGRAQVYEGCVDLLGRPVASIPAAIDDIAKASLAPNGRPVIYYNPQVLSAVAPQTRVFFYMHECGHHALGHAVVSIPFTREQQADCFAIVQLVSNGVFDDYDVRVVQRELARFGIADWTHLPGPRRAINLRACLASASAP